MSVKNCQKVRMNTLHFQLVVEERSPYWSIVKYYQEVEKEKSKQMLLEALWQYWLPLALKEQCALEEQERGEKEAREAIYWLQQQINLLQSQFGVKEGKQESLKPLAYRRSGTARFRFRCQPRTQENKLRQLTDYLMDVPEVFALEQKLLCASVAYWGAIADRELGLLDEEGLNQSAANCIIRLRQHIEYLEDCFQLKEAPVVPVMAVPAGWGMPRVNQGQLNQEEGQEEVKKETTENDDEEIQSLLRGNPKNDQLIEKMFDN